jgi:hypothetical protein
VAGRYEKAGRAGSASQSQRMHGAGYVGAIVGQGENFEF